MTQHTKEPFDWDNVPLIRARYTEAQAKITQLRQDKAEMLAALRPFANLFPSNLPLNDPLGKKLQSWAKAARAAIADAEKES